MTKPTREEYLNLCDRIISLVEIEEVRLVATELKRLLQPGIVVVPVEIFKVYASGRCYCCNWPLAASADDGCVVGNCSFRPTERHPLYQGWHDRMVLLSEAMLQAAEGE